MDDDLLNRVGVPAGIEFAKRGQRFFRSLAPAAETERSGRRSIFGQHIAEQHVIEIIEAGTKRLILVGKLGGVGAEVERLEFRPARSINS